MWTPTTRHQHSRAGLRYGSDLTDKDFEATIKSGEAFLYAASAILLLRRLKR